MLPVMKNYLLPAGIVVVLLGGALALVLSREPAGPAVNPDPNHTHADLAVWVNGQQLDFTDERYMSGAPEDGEQRVREAHPLRQYLHLHDGVGHVIHRHKPGLTLGDFFVSIGLPMTESCLTLDDYQYALLDEEWIESFDIGRELCTNGKFHWRMFVNGSEIPFDPGYEFQDLDKILLVYGAGDQFPDQWAEMSDDACLYSRTCPERGDPPAENCIADPAIPCVIVE